jgi:hypothetical protein
VRCARCHFENIPGQERCVRCGSVLEAGAAALEVHPPRMPAWRRPFRYFTRWLRSHRPAGSRRPAVAPRRAGSDLLFGLALNVVPGLGYLLRGRWREVRLLVAAWLVLVSAGIFFYGSTAGSLLLGLAIGIHTWIALRFSLFREITDFAGRAVATLLLVAVLAGLYRGVPRLLLPGYTGAYTALTIPDLNVRTGDYLLVRRRRGSQALPRGTLVLVHPPRQRNMQRDPLDDGRAQMLGQIVGLPGEVVHVRGNVYVVGEQILKPERFPVPPWLRDRPVHVQVPADSYFVSSPYEVTVRGRQVTDEAIRNVSVFPADEIRGRAFLRWWPLSRRGFIE